MEAFKKITFFLFVAFILFLFIWAVFMPKAQISHRIAETIKTQTERADLAFRGVTVSETVDGIKYWEIKAKTSDINEDTSLAILLDADGTFFDEGKPGLKFISPKILWQMNKKEIEMKQPFGFDAKSEKKARRVLASQRKNFFSLPLKDGSGYYFKAEKLNWTLKDKKITCRGDIWIRRGEIIGKAESLKSDVKLAKVLLGGNPFILVGSPHVATMEAMYFEFDSPKDTITAQGDVTILSGNKKASGDKGIYNIKSGIISLAGNVNLEEDDSSLTGEKVVYAVKKNKFTISGKSKAVIPEKRLKGEDAP